MRPDHQVICVPSDDPAFEADVRTTIARLGRTIEDEADLVAAVADALRTRYPEISIRSRDPIASFASGEPTAWYVLRNGRRGGSSGGADEHGDPRA